MHALVSILTMKLQTGRVLDKYFEAEETSLVYRDKMKTFLNTVSFARHFSSSLLKLAMKMSTENYQADA